MDAARRIPVAPLVAAGLLLLVPAVVPGWVLFLSTLAVARFLGALSVALFLRAGLVSFGHAMFYAVGAYTVGFAAKWLGAREVLVLVPLAAVMGAAAAALVGLVMARYRGVFFSMLNLAFSMMLYGALLKLYWFSGGTDGLGISQPTLLWSLLPREAFRPVWYYVTLAVAGIVIYAIYRFLGSPLGFYLRALADNEIRIEYSGESVRRVVYSTYVVSGAVAGLGGALVAFTVGHIVPEYAYWITSGEFVFVALLGGFTSVPGPLVGSFAFEFIRTYASKYFPDAWQMTLGIVMLLIILFRPGGLWTVYEGLAARFGRGTREAEGA